MAACELTWEYLFPDKPIPLAVKLLSLYDSWTYQGHELEPMVLPFQMRMRMEQLDPKDWDKCGHFWLDLFEAGLSWPAGSISAEYTVKAMVDEGKLLLRYDEEQKRRYVQAYGFETKLIIPCTMSPMFPAVYKVIAVNLGHTNSKVFDSVWRKECPRCRGKRVKIFTSSLGALGDSYHTAPCDECSGIGYVEPYDLMITFVRRTDHRWNVSLYSTKSDIDCGSIAKSFGGGGRKDAAGFQCTELPFVY